jgi:hypothetical protein
MEMTTTIASCPISGSALKPVFSATVLGRHEVTYYYCKESGLLKTEQPFWLEDAYQDAISGADTGLVQRNISNSHILEPILGCLGLAQGRLLDFAGGYGLLTRLMRDKGFDCYTTDKYCANIFAQTFEPGTDFKADALFAFEVMEHIEDPLSLVRDLFKCYSCRTLIFSTVTFGPTVPGKDWWYYGFESGQHITFYQPWTLALLADLLECTYYMLRPDLHLITNRTIPRLNRFVLQNSYARLLYSKYIRGRRKALSKTWDDHLKMKEQLRTKWRS